MTGSALNLKDTVRDLRRRKVFRATAAYGVVAWLVVEISSVVLPALLLPDWTLRVVIVTAIAGFPLAIIIAWIFDITSDGIVRTTSVSGADAPAADAPAAGGRVVDFIIIGVLLAAVVFLLVRPDGQAGQERSIAVLPFADMSADRDSAYFADGISEELLNSLVAVPGLKVAARTSSFAFRGQHEDIRIIGERLNVDTVLEGSVRRDGDQIKITAQLIDASNGFHLWSQSYDRRLTDIFRVQEEISMAIVDALRIKLVGGEAIRMARADPANIEAYDLYLLGRHHWHQRTPESLNRAVELFRQAIDSDPQYALAYAGLADSYLLLTGYGGMPKTEALRNAEPLVARALSLDPGLAEAYASQGLLRWIRGDLASAEMALRGAVELNENYVMGHMWLGGVLSDGGRLRDALAEYRAAWELDRLHPVINSNMATTLAGMGRFDEAAVYVERIANAAPASDRAFMTRVGLATQAGRYDEAARYGLAAQELDPTNAKLTAMLADIFASLGDFDTAREWLGRLGNPASEDRHVTGTRMHALFLIGDLQAVARLCEEQLRSVGDWRSADFGADELDILIWPGIERTVVGDYPEAAALLERVVKGGLVGSSPADKIGVRLILAEARERLGDNARARELVDESLAIAADARAQGWVDPRLTARLAAIQAMRNDMQGALVTMQQAVEQGWRDYWFSMRLPVYERLRDNPEYRQLLDTVKADIDRMRARVESATAGRSERRSASGGG